MAANMTEKTAFDQTTPVGTEPGTPPLDQDGLHVRKAEYGNDTESLVSDTTLVASQEGMKPAFIAKAGVLNKAIQDIGFGRYQYELFFSGGFGWFADNWLQAVAIVMDSIAHDKITDDSSYEPWVRVRFATLSLYAGLIVGAFFWGITADVIGRKIAWNCTLFLGGVFGIAAGGAPTFIVFCVMVAMMGFGVGGNLPVDGTMFLEFMPGTHQWLLTFLSIWWAVGQVVASLIAWAFLANFGCKRDAYPKLGEPVGPDSWCDKSDNMGWRYTYYTLGTMMVVLWGLRFFVLPVFESPKFLASLGKDKEAVEIIHKLAKRNGKTTTLTVEDLHRAALPHLSDEDKMRMDAVDTKFSVPELIKNSLEEFKGDKIRTLFSTKRLAWSTSLIVLCYGAVGLAYPLYNSFLTLYLRSKGVSPNGDLNELMKTYTYQAACGVPGSFAAAALVSWSTAGRKFSMAFFTICAGIFLFALTASKTVVQVNALTSIAAFFQNAYYGVLFGYAPELFPTPVRGTGDALCASFNRVTGFFAPIIAIFSQAGETPDGPVFASAGIYIATGVLMMFLPIETYGKTAL